MEIETVNKITKFLALLGFISSIIAVLVSWLMYSSLVFTAISIVYIIFFTYEVYDEFWKPRKEVEREGNES
jgi:preprotein translocase subunit SecY